MDTSSILRSLPIAFLILVAISMAFAVSFGFALGVWEAFCEPPEKRRLRDRLAVGGIAVAVAGVLAALGGFLYHGFSIKNRVAESATMKMLAREANAIQCVNAILSLGTEAIPSHSDDEYSRSFFSFLRPPAIADSIDNCFRSAGFLMQQDPDDLFPDGFVGRTQRHAGYSLEREEAFVSLSYRQCRTITWYDLPAWLALVPSDDVIRSMRLTLRYSVGPAQGPTRYSLNCKGESFKF